MRKFFDSAVGEKPLHKYDIILTIFSILFTVWCFLMFISTVGPTNEIKYAAIVFVLLLFDIFADMWTKRKLSNEWIEINRFEYQLFICFKVIFLCIVPALTMNQLMFSDYSTKFGVITIAVIVTYCMPGVRNIFEENVLYSFAINSSLLINLIVSLRTTLYGTMCAICLFFSSALRVGRPKRLLLFLSRVLTAYIAYLALSACPIPKCYPPITDGCQMTEEQCKFFRTYYACKHDMDL